MKIPYTTKRPSDSLAAKYLPEWPNLKMAIFRLQKCFSIALLFCDDRRLSGVCCPWGLQSVFWQPALTPISLCVMLSLCHRDWTYGNYISQTPLPSRFWMSFLSARVFMWDFCRWEEKVVLFFSLAAPCKVGRSRETWSSAPASRWPVSRRVSTRLSSDEQRGRPAFFWPGWRQRPSSDCLELLNISGNFPKLRQSFP